MSNPRYDWWGYAKAVIRRYPRLKDADVSGAALREKEAVQAAVEATERMENGKDRIAVINMVFWRQTHTLAGAAMQIPCHYETARHWHSDFIKEVGRNLNLMD